MKLKKILSLILTIIMILSLSACNENDTAEVSKIPITSGAYTPGATLSEFEEALKNENSTTISSKESASTSSKKSNNSSSKKANTTTSAKNSSKGTTKPNVEGPMLYKVTNDKGNVVWLFGSIHIGKEFFYPLPDYVMNAFNSSDVLAVEFDIVAFEKDVAAQTKAMAKLISPNYSTKSHLVGDSAASIYRKAVEILDKNNMYNSSLNDYYKPVMWSTLIDNLTYQKAGAASEYGVDRHLLNRAKQKKKKIEEIESAESQYSMLAGFSDALQTKMLEDAIKGYESNTAKAELDSLMGLWAKGNASELGELFNQDLSAIMNETDTQKREILNEYYTAMYTDREIVMRDYIKNALNSGKEAFVCVGAAHLARAMGIIERLKVFEGLNVEEVN